MLQVVIIIVLSVLVFVAAIGGFAAGNAYRRNVAEAKIGKAEDKAKEIIDDALKSAESKKRDILLTAKEDALKTKNEIEKEVKAIDSEI